MYKPSKEIKPFENGVFLSTPTPHHEMLDYIHLAYDTNLLSTMGENISVVESEMAERTGVKYAVGLSSGTSALHMCVKLAGVKPEDTVFCTDMTFSATVNPVSYEFGRQVFIDSEYDTWNMDPESLEKAFEKYPDTKVVVVADLYGTPAKLDEIRSICDTHGAMLIEDAAEALGAIYNGKPCGCYGEYNAISFNGNKVITSSTGGMLLTNDEEAVEKVRKWSTQARDAAPWYQHSELGYNYRMSNIVAGALRGQIPYLDEHIAQKKEIYYRYVEGLKGYPVSLNPVVDSKDTKPNYWLSCLLVDKDAMCPQTRTDYVPTFDAQHGKSCPTEILEALSSVNAIGRPIWKPMHMQPIFDDYDYVSARGTNPKDFCNEDIFARGLCLPSDNKMTEEEQTIVIEVIRRCFD